MIITSMFCTPILGREGYKDIVQFREDESIPKAGTGDEQCQIMENQKESNDKTEVCQQR